MTALPHGWKLTALDDLQSDEPRSITDGPFGSNLTRAHYTASGPRVVRLQNIGDGVFNDARAHISEAHFETLRNHDVRPGDLLVASLGEVLPRACIAPASLGPAIVKADCIRVRLSSEVDPRWVMYSMQQPQVRRWADDHRHGVGRPRLGLKAIREIPVPLPPLDEQRRIVDILEDHLSRLDAAEADMNNAYCRASSLRTAVVCAELARFEGPQRTIHQLSESVRNGIFVSRAKAEPNGVPILRIGAVRPLSLDLGDLRYSERDELDLQREDSLLAPGDLLFTRYNGNPRFVGACAVVPENAGPLTYPDKLIRVRISAREAVPDYVALACTVGAGREQIHSHVKTTSGQAGISGRDLKAVTLVVPSIEHQQAVVVAAHERLDAVVELSKMISVSARRCGSLRRSLLAAAFSGRLTGRISDMEMVEEIAGV